MHIHRDTIVRVALIPQLRWIQLLTLSYMCVRVLQIRQEKPYYIADPEVDSLVSITLFTRHERSETFFGVPRYTPLISAHNFVVDVRAREIGRLSTIESRPISPGARGNRHALARSSEASALNYGTN